MEKRTRLSEKKKHSILVDHNGNKIILTEEDHIGARGGATKLSEESEEAVCKICWGTEKEDLAKFREGEE